MNECKIIFKKFDNSSVAEFIELSKVEYGDLPTVTNSEHINWKYNNNPDGKSVSINLMANDKVVGRIILQPRIFIINNKNVPAAFATDALVHPDYRRPVSNFINLINSIEKVKEFSLILHTSNENTEPIYSKLLHFNCPVILSGYGVPLGIEQYSLKNIQFKEIII